MFSRAGDALAGVCWPPLRQGFGGHVFARGDALENMAERQGFEPWLRLPEKRRSFCERVGHHELEGNPVGGNRFWMRIIRMLFPI
jgi:hypothetical protein